MAKTFRRTARTNEEFVPRTTRTDRRNMRRGAGKVALRQEIESALVNA